MPLGKRTDCGDARFSGYEIPTFHSDVANTLQEALQTIGFDFVVCPITDPAYRPRAPAPHNPAKPLPPGPSYKQRVYFDDSNLAGRVVAAMSDWIDVDSSDASQAAASSDWLQGELAWASFLGFHAVLLPAPKDGINLTSYAQSVFQVLSQELQSMKLWLRIPVAVPAEEGMAAANDDDDGPDTWQWWNAFRTLCEHSDLLGAALEVSDTLPSEARLARWMGENIKCCIVKQSAFITNPKGFPILPKAHQTFLSSLLARGVQIVFSPGPPSATTPATILDEPSPSQPPHELQHPHHIYYEYLSFLFRRLPEPSDRELHEVSYRDYLQHPLQPLQDNLESATYEVFEVDRMKYVQYEEAVYRALLDRVPDSAVGTSVTVLMVVGAGRGPLVRASLRASLRSGRRLRVYAVEKNPHAVVVLHHMIDTEPDMQGVVEVVHVDMRTWEAPELADIMVSELLGSFGDNELSPECLDGAQRFLKPDGISIPQSYTSYLQPLTAHKLWSDARAYKALKELEMPYVVNMHRVCPLSQPSRVFTFSHPNWVERAADAPRPIDNRRRIRLAYQRGAGAGDALVHGFAGYFECQLYKNVELSTHPDTHTPEMRSWFPVYFPLREPLLWPEGTELGATMWRCVGPRKVWYEWAVVLPGSVGPIHNVGGRSYYVGL